MRLKEATFVGTGSGGPIAEISIGLRGDQIAERSFEPLCLIGPNGSGKSQFLQALAEAIQVVWHACSPTEERVAYDEGPDFEIVFELVPEGKKQEAQIIKISRRTTSNSKRRVCVETDTGDEWLDHDLSDPSTRNLLPQRVVAYTSGDNETLSVPFFDSSLAYGDEVQRSAFDVDGSEPVPAAPRLQLIDYGTHLEILVANLLLGNEDQRKYLLEQVHLDDLRSVRCIVQLAHGKISRSRPVAQNGRKGVQLTKELESYIEKLQASATAWQLDQQTETYTFDFWVDAECRRAFARWFLSPFECYQAFHKLSLLNSLTISGAARERFRKAVNRSRFAARLPEPPDEDKVFRFEQVSFTPSGRPADTPAVDYVSLSDGEHQQVQLLGTFAMITDSNVLFLLDEPESHFNPQWRVEFLSRLMDVPVPGGTRRSGAPASMQDVILTTHAPFVPSDMPRENVLIFARTSDGKLEVSRPTIQTFGASYEEILASCFKVSPPISELSREVVAEIMNSDDVSEIEDGLSKLGPSIEKALVSDHLRQVIEKSRDVLPPSN